MAVNKEMGRGWGGWLSCCALFLLCAATLGCIRDEPFVKGFADDAPAAGVLAAVDAETCAVLAADWFSGRWILKSAEYENLVQQKRAIRIQNGTKVDQVERSLLENGHLVPFRPNADKEHSTADVSWVIPKRGPYKGRKVCVFSGAVRTSYPPPL